jgi:hypothetical protein
VLNGGAAAVVKRYYAAVDLGAYREAWSLLSPGLQVRLGGFTAWHEGYRYTESTNVSSARVIGTTGSTSTVAVELRASDLDACGDHVPQTFAGTWNILARGASLQAIDFSVKKTSGGTPVRDPSACAPPPTTTTTTQASCDPNYSGACLDPNSADYDCEGGTGDGPDYTGPVTVVGDDHYDLDSDGDGSACES